MLIGSVSIGAVITLVGELLLSEEAKTAATKAKHESRVSRGETATAGASNSGQARQQHSRGTRGRMGRRDLLAREVVGQKFRSP